MVEVFKTSVSDESTANELLNSLQCLLPLASINFDLQDCDRILRIEIKSETIQHLVKTHLKEKDVECETLE